ncbi:penicillin-insensitive murein endopeptidase [Methylobacter sp. S3L5C]|uniref:penicillin-insensitive murein endopeptidase n=1 Tax=Methylobacter sp. S3L5C TaxID=2839024 RepID=UPI001FAB745A|nr:penicillin-insensitive murein endopeptidase [Methylobacter sp. S3L5C]UOA10372.1 penicillin-insensitive murein endopeptidase [Methylobacter sp. S3L5C]
MLKVKALFFTGLLLTGILSECLASSLAQQWAMVTQPTYSISQSIGTYNAGCISGAVSVPANGIGYQMMRLSRKRSFGHPDLKQFIEKLGQTAATQQLGSLLIGDLGQPRGGPTLSGHRSHQSGLDVDIWFLLSKQAANRTLAMNERETWSAPSVLAGQSDAINYNQWSLVHEKVLEVAARMPEVDRIFVNPSIKRELCIRHTSEGWLRKIRPWWKHDDHFHVRLKCPKDNKYCQGQEALPQGDGCDAGLNWWFTEEAKHPAPSKTPPKPLVLPERCDAVLKE